MIETVYSSVTVSIMCINIGDLSIRCTEAAELRLKGLTLNSHHLKSIIQFLNVCGVI